MQITFPFAGLESRIRGGVHPEARKESTAGKAIDTDFPLPSMLYIALQQHVGQPAEPVVKVGDRVFKGQLIAVGQGNISASLHAPTSGVVADIIDYPAAHPSALPTPTLLLETDSLDLWQQEPETCDPFSLPPEEISIRVAAAGVVGMGGAAFPSAVKLNLGRRTRIKTLLINGGECEPYLTCDDRLMQERADDIVDGIRIMLHGLECRDAMVGIEDNKPLAFAAMRAAAASYPSIQVLQVPTLYPMGWDKQMIRYLTGKEVPADGRATDVGVLMHNIGTAYAVQQAIRYGRPLTRRVVTVSGGAVKTPRNVEVPIGTLLTELFSYCGLDINRARRFVLGGPMMGDILPHTRVPVIKGACGILALSAEEINEQDSKACIRCSRCVTACPTGLLPLEMMVRIRAGQLDGALNYGLRDCISCASCSYACPSGIPLVSYFKYANSELVARDQASLKSEQTKKLADEKTARLERIKQEQLAMAAKRKAETEARKKEAEARKQAKEEEARKNKEEA
ncbi:electron transport complex subunit RsxC [Candidatus Methylospira mobilis]|uniref:Ion-translocating oxidoreductase complex subunit C n=1 Tax=Candidatus Methylospira mobilis TaxID=1808979 RepID=A0A5Q0BH72_9GAMM|nr:electron transport complex subunit RsxC [Candidatus Methylospira mobilis]QFY42482.1 electron transport complex subunit RsxC [Candidatus Methylospira mobilis]